MIKRFAQSKLAEVLLMIVWIFALIVDVVLIIATFLVGLGSVLIGNLLGVTVGWLVCAAAIVFGMWLFGAFEH